MADAFMPEYWPANRIIGKLEKALVKAENILGLIQSAQIENLVAGKVTGLLTSAQIAEIEAAKVSGKLTSEQIESIKASQISGKLTNAQLESIEAAKITGVITETQIGPEAVTTPKLKAGAITTAKLAAGSVTAEILAAGSVTTEKLVAGSVNAGALAAGSVTTAKLAAEAITAEKIGAGQILTAKLAAGAVTAEKLSVATLSAISANLGTVTAGTLKAVVIESGTGSFEGELKATSLTMPSGSGVTPATKDIIRWLDAETSAVNAFVYGNKNFSEKQLVLGPRDSGTTGVRLVLMDQRPENTRMQAALQTLKGALIIEDNSSGGGSVSLVTQTNAVTKSLIADNETSDFLFRKGGTATKGRIAAGTVTITYAGATEISNSTNVVHGLGVKPITVVVTGVPTKAGQLSLAYYFTPTETQFTVRGYAPNKPAAGDTAEVTWIAIA